MKIPKKYESFNRLFFVITLLSIVSLIFPCSNIQQKQVFSVDPSIPSDSK